MRFLVYGAGNIGSLHAARLAQSSQEVAILAKRLVKSMSPAEIPIFTGMFALPGTMSHFLRISGHTRPVHNVVVSNIPGPESISH